VPKLKFFNPTSALKPSDTASAASSVDFPEPFSPVKYVTVGCKSIRSRWRTEGKQNGNRSNEPTVSWRSESELTYCLEIMR